MPDSRSRASGGGDSPSTNSPGSDGVASSDAPGSDGAAETGTGGEGRSVVVPDRIYKTVTVFSTLFAVVTVVGGFVVLDGATNRAQAPVSEIDPLLALAGIALILFGAVTYAFSTRFEAEGMGNAKDDTDEPSNDG